MTDLGTLGGYSSVPVAVNDRGHVLGCSDTADLRVHPFVWRRGEMIDIGVDVVAREDLSPLDINNRGQVTGTRLDPSRGASAFYWHNGQLVDLGQVAGAPEGSTAFDITTAARTSAPSTADPSSGPSARDGAPVPQPAPIPTRARLRPGRGNRALVNGGAGSVVDHCPGT